MSLFTNAEADALSLDGLVNDNALVPTRRNGPKPSYQFLVDGWNAEFAAKIIEINKSRGFRVVGTFSTGFTYELLNDVGIDAAGNSWIYTGTDALPKIITAGTVPSTPDFQQVTYNDHSGLVNLNSEGGHDEIYARSVNSLKSLVAYTPALVDGQKFDVTGFYANTKVGGGLFIWDSLRSKTEHNGGTVIAPEAIAAWDGSAANIATLLNWTGTGTGCWVRTITGNAFIVEWFGAGSGTGDDSPIIRACYDAAKLGATRDTAIEVRTIRGYSDRYIINTSLTLGDTSAVAIVDMEIMGAFVTLASLPFAIKLRGFKNPQIKLGRMLPTANGVNTGLIVENTFNGDIFVDQVGNYKSPVIYHGDASYGFGGNAYFHFKCGQAGGATHTINVVEMTTVGIGYNNSVKTEITAARGDVFSKHTKGTAQIDPYNANIYVNCGLEDIRLVGFDWDFSAFNHVDHPRLEANNGLVKFTQGVIKESATCFGNTYDLFTTPISQIGTLNTESIVNARFLDAGGSVRAKQVSQTLSGRIYHSDRADGGTASNKTIFTEGTTSATSVGNPLSKYRGFFKDNAGVVHPYGLGTPFGVKRITSYTAGDTVSCDYASTIDVAVNSGALRLRSHLDREMEGFEIIVWIRNAGMDITFSSNDGSLPIAATAFATTGVYMIKRIDFRWRTTKLGDQFVVS